MNPLASIVVPTFRRPGLVVKCIEALLQQSAAPASYEIIVVTDGPDPATSQAVRELQSRKEQIPVLRLKSLPRHSGPAAARNIGWQIARGQLIIFTDDDCLPAPGFVEAYLQQFREEAISALAYTGKVQVPISVIPTDYEKNIAQLETASFITANCAISKDALLQTGGFDEDFSMAWREDSAMEFCLLKKGIPIRYIEQALVLHPVRRASWGVSLRSEKKNMYNALLYKKHTDLYNRKIRSKPPLIYYAILIAAGGILAAGLLPSGMVYLSLLLWLVLTFMLIGKRLHGTCRTPAHVLEIIITSMAIPALSVYWNTYGCIRYKCLLL